MWWTAQEDATIVRMSSEGASAYQIAATINRSLAGVKSRMWRLTLSAWRPATATNPNLVEDIRRLAAPADLSARQIGDRLGVTRNTIIGLARRHGIKLRAPLPADPDSRRGRSHARRAVPTPDHVSLASTAAAPPTHDGSAEKVPDRLEDTPVAILAASSAPADARGRQSGAAVTNRTRGRGLVFVELNDLPEHPRFCRFISDAEAQRPILVRRCCGQDTVGGTSWCAEHVKLFRDPKRTRQSTEKSQRRDAA